jgi:hypothetical protein
VQVTLRARNLEAPGTPFALMATVSGRNVGLSWMEPVSGGQVESYAIEVGSAPGQSNIGTMSTTSTSVLVTDAPSGTFYVRVRALNDAGTSAPSTEVRVVV